MCDGADKTGGLFGDPRWDTFGLLREAYLTVSALIDTEVAADGDLPPDLADLVFRLARTSGHTLRTIQITRSLSTTTTRTTRLVDEAERRGLVVRQTDPGDRRATLVRLTADGLAAAVRAGRVALDAAQRHVHDVLDDTTITVLTSALRQLRDAAAQTPHAERSRTARPDIPGMDEHGAQVAATRSSVPNPLRLNRP